MIKRNVGNNKSNKPSRRKVVLNQNTGYEPEGNTHTVEKCPKCKRSTFAPTGILGKVCAKCGYRER